MNSATCRIQTGPSGPPSRRPEPQAWRDAGSCKGLPATMFFPGQGESVVEAQAVCAACAVAIECAEYALASNQRFGIWGGTTERERRRLRAERRAAVARAGEVSAA